MKPWGRCGQVSAVFCFALACGDGDDGSATSSGSGGSSGSSVGSGGIVITECVQYWLQAQIAKNIVFDVTTNAGQTWERDFTLCPGDSHYFELDLQCAAYVGLDVRGAGGVLLPDGDDVDLFLRETYDKVADTQLALHNSLGEQSATSDDLGYEILHRRLPMIPDADHTHLIEVRNNNLNDNVSYRLSIQALPEGTCQSAAYVCEAWRASPSEIGCIDEPDPTCKTKKQTLALPQVWDGTQTVDGWIVHADPSEVKYAHAPTTSELAALGAKCEQACEDHWEDSPAVSISCGSSSSFREPYHRLGPSIGAQALIPDGLQDGSGIFTGQALTCDLRSTCCLAAFDEEVCRAKPDRVTPGPDMLQTGEEYRLNIGGASEVVLTSGGNSASSGLTGTIGYSFCEGGNASGPCPFYVGSAQVSSSAIASLSLECSDGTQEVHRFDNLSLSLSQPAMGVQKDSSSAVGFPPGALLMDASLRLGGITYERRGANAENVYGTATASSFSANGLDVVFEMPCGTAGAAQVVASFDLQTPLSGAVLDGPPSVDITMVGITSCGSTVNFSANASDPDGDLDRVRWYVDDQIFHPSYNSFKITQGHTIRAVAFDSRGAATTDTHTIVCI